MAAIVDRGAGTPVVLVPGIQGRWEWMEETVDALARRARCVSFSLCGEPGTRCRLTAERGFDAHVDQLDRVLDHAKLDRVALCGVSYGGWISVRYAARRPDRITSLVLASAPGPAFRPDARQQRYVHYPWLLLPGFLASTRQRLAPEIAAALPDPAVRRKTARRQYRRILRHPISPGLMAQRIRLALKEDFAADCASLDLPTLVVTGEAGLDRVVPVETTLEYTRLIRGAEHRQLPTTGHIGCVTCANEWADLVMSFVDRERTGETEGLRSRATGTGAEAAGLKPFATGLNGCTSI